MKVLAVDEDCKLCGGQGAYLQLVPGEAWRAPAPGETVRPGDFRPRTICPCVHAVDLTEVRVTRSMRPEIVLEDDTDGVRGRSPQAGGDDG